jgi:hypothetical protein
MTGCSGLVRFSGALLTVFFFCCVPVYGGARPFNAGEVLHYNIRQLGVKVGEASLEFAGPRSLPDGRPAELIVFTSRAMNFFDEERIFLSPDNFSPLRVERTLNIFGSREAITEEYFPSGRIRITKVADGKTSEQEIDRKRPVDNIYGFIYRYRAEGKFNMDEKFEINLPTKDVMIRPVDEMNFNADGKIYRAVLMKSVPSRYSIWMDKSPKRFPLRIAGAVGLANTVMTMTGYEERNGP